MNDAHLLDLKMKGMNNSSTYSKRVVGIITSRSLLLLCFHIMLLELVRGLECNESYDVINPILF
jgi:hypothetical protein